MSLNKKDAACSRGQAVTLDFVILSFALMIILLTFIYTWNFIGIRWNNISEYNRQYLTGLTAADALVTSAGNPPGWENLQTIDSSTLFSLGLANEKNILNPRKLDRLANLSAQNYSFFRERLGATSYQVFINVTNSNRTVSYYAIGIPQAQINETVAFERLVIFNGSVSIVRLEIWK